MGVGYHVSTFPAWILQTAADFFKALFNKSTYVSVLNESSKYGGICPDFFDSDVISEKLWYFKLIKIYLSTFRAQCTSQFLIDSAFLHEKLWAEELNLHFFSRPISKINIFLSVSFPRAREWRSIFFLIVVLVIKSGQQK